MSLLLAPSGGAPDWLQFVLVLLFLGGGAVRAIFQSKRAGNPPKAPSPGTRSLERPPQTVREGLERWRELMEGRTQEAPPPPPPRRAPAPVAEPEPEPSYESLVQLELSEPASFASTPSEEELEARGDETAGVEVLEHRAVAELAIGHGEVGSGLRAVRLRRWRGAVLAAEALGRPLALRPPESLPGALPR